MNSIAIWIGYAVMTAGGVAIALAVLWLAAEACWRMWISGMNLGDILEATEAWRRANPGKFKRWKKRNRIDEVQP